MGFLFNENLPALKCSMPGCDHKAEFLVAKCHPSAGVVVELNEIGVLLVRCADCNKYVIQVPVTRFQSSQSCSEPTVLQLVHDRHPDSALEMSIDIQSGVVRILCLDCKVPIAKGLIMSQEVWASGCIDQSGGDETGKPELVELTEDAVYIHDTDGDEIVCWVQSEWEDDPTIVPSIINAVKVVLTEGPDALRKMISGGDEGTSPEDTDTEF
jgi:hypothetical protein